MDTGVQVDIEIQLTEHPAFRERVIFYLSRLYSSQISSGEQYHVLRKTISLIILDYILTPQNHCTPDTGFKTRDNDIELTDVMEVHLIELPKLKEVIQQHKNNPEIAWLAFLNAKTKKKLKMAAEAEPKIAKAYTRLIEVSNDEENRRLYDERQNI